jgi:hypothetical protein
MLPVKPMPPVMLMLSVMLSAMWMLLRLLMVPM